jgi:hypothetical protein
LPPPVARAEKRIPVIGFLSGGLDPSEVVRNDFRDGLSESGYEVGKTVRVEYRSAGGKYDELKSLADELIGLHVDAIVTIASYHVALAAKRSTSTIPIVFFTGVDPVRLGLVQSINKPGGNLTGVAIQSNELAAKRIELLQELLPGTGPIAVLVNSANLAVGDELKNAEEIIRKLGREFILVQASNKSEIETAFAAKLNELGDDVAPLDTPQSTTRVGRGGNSEPATADGSGGSGSEPLAPIGTVNPTRKLGGDRVPRRKAATTVQAAIQQVTPLSKPVRMRDRDHLRFVTTQPCLACGRSPSDAHHLRFAEQRALGRKVSDEFTVPLCRLHHRELHRRGDERTWWQHLNVDPLDTAQRLWQQTRPKGIAVPTSGGAESKLRIEP